MSVQPTDQFLTLNLFKALLRSTDTQDDDSYAEFVDNSNSKVQTAIFRYIDTPIGTGSPFWKQCKNAAVAYARSLQAEDIELIEKSKNYLEKYNIELYGEGGTEALPMAGGLIQELIAARTNRTETVLAVYDPRRWKVVLPSQLDLASSERFQ